MDEVASGVQLWSRNQVTNRTQRSVSRTDIQHCLAKYPLMPLRMLHQRTQVASPLVCFIHGIVRHCHVFAIREKQHVDEDSQVHISGGYYLPLYFQSVREASPFHSGLLLSTLILAEALTAITAGVFIHRTGVERESGNLQAPAGN